VRDRLEPRERSDEVAFEIRNPSTAATKSSPGGPADR
jgi:hypothetical protein